MEKVKKETKVDFKEDMFNLYSELENTYNSEKGYQGRYTYTPLPSLLNEIKPTLAKYNFFIRQTFSTDLLVTELVHISGETVSSTMKLYDYNGDAQKLGGWITYMRRYAITALLNIAGDDDNDGQGVVGNTEVMRKEADKAMEEVKKGDDVLASRLRIKIKNTVFMEDLQQLKQEIADAGKVLNKEQFESVIAEAKKKKDQLQGVEISDEELNNLDFSK